MGKGRLEAFSDGVLAIIITIMVLEMKVPHGDDLLSLKPLLPVFISYILSFINIAIYWNNHHHLIHAAHKINGKVMWANSHLLFWLSLMPFASIPTAVFGVDLFMAGIAYYILAKCLVKLHGEESTIGKAVGNDVKGRISLVVYAAGILLACFNGWISLGLYALVAVMWFIPDRRIEKKLEEETE
jgi:uncharacterized membrane protein